MENEKPVTLSAKVDPGTMQDFENAFRDSGAKTKNDFIKSLLENRNNPGEETQTKTEIKIQEIEKKLDINEILFSLNPIQFFALREHVLSSDDFAEKQNSIINRLNTGDKPFFYSGNLFEPAFQKLWVKNQIITGSMAEEQKEAAIKHNMCAFILNMYFTKLIEGEVENSSVTPDNLKAFISEQNTELN